MCGIVGYLGEKDALTVVLEGLSRLEYRGYDSAGVSFVDVKGHHSVIRAEGKLERLKESLKSSTIQERTKVCIGHTRWATHGKPSEANAHPHRAGRVTIIHNGIIENYVEIKEELKKSGAVFTSETDTEVAAHLLRSYLEEGLEPIDALKRTCSKIRGSFAFVALDEKHPDTLLVAKTATPIVIGIGDGEIVVASDIPAVLPTTKKVLFLEDGDVAEVKASGVKIFQADKEVSRKIETITWDAVTAQKGGFKHYMLKEVHEQVLVVSDAMRGRVHESRVSFPELASIEKVLKDVERVVIVACGTAWHAGLVAKFYLESIGIPVEVDYASEFRYRNLPLNKKTLVIAVSQSGETADTLAAIEVAKKSSPTIAICNVVGSSLTRKVDASIFTQAGPEISVASTKAFTTQLVVAKLFSIHLGLLRGAIKESDCRREIDALNHLPTAVKETLSRTAQIEKIAKHFHGARDFIFLGRGNCFPIALEGALKLKEISYIHAEGYPSGEIKHGPLALIDEKVPVVILLQKSDILFEKSISNLREVEARGGKIIAISDSPLSGDIASLCADVVLVPHVSEFLSPILLTLPLQLLAYFVAVQNGTDVDLPRNLAKSVTVE